ncbi:DUF1311 domain-containing protein [Sphingomonas sp. PL-96]|uniref:lysozyme inhibitor LprI family protein n=1 Tax=Sphingomonas sp. PL-96 TaxID=2887201 RepID=UPI001E395A9F|nr:lysozyme inhibitor LprI family protein [Sphingomonas sp. PL-96]MCC2975423.1 DUF1311 domain-containing protein [Sphingomonas sp. PL-96]
MPLFTLALFLQAANPASCTGDDTPSINACASAEFDAADAELNRYYQAAMRRLRSEGEGEAAKELVKAQRAWIQYRDAECGAVYQNWSGGSIRTLMGISCQTRLTKLRTHVIWSHWLTYMDSTPPILPRPDLSVLRDDDRP